MNGLEMHLGALPRLSNAKTRSISPENFTGASGLGGMATEGTGAHPARDLGQGWKVSPSVMIGPNETFVLADINGPAAIQHFWITNLTHVRSRDLILRIHWDGQENPSVEVPLGDFFCCGWEEYAAVSSLAVCVNPGRGFNCYWIMPFQKRALITLENRGLVTTTVYYQINYAETELPADCAYFHAHFYRNNPTTYKENPVILETEGAGHYVGLYLAWGVNSNGWWGEGEMKFFIDDDWDFPTICGTGLEDYFCGSHNFDVGAAEAGKPQAYQEYNTPYAGLPQIIRPDGVYKSQQRFGMYRWHITDPIRFKSRLKMTVQALGWDSGNMVTRKYKPLQDDVASTVFWYQTLPTSNFRKLQRREILEI